MSVQVMHLGNRFTDFPTTANVHQPNCLESLDNQLQKGHDKCGCELKILEGIEEKGENLKNKIDS